MLGYQLTESVVYVFYKMEFVRDLCHWLVKCCYGRTIICRPVTTDELHLSMSLHPLTKAVCFSVPKQVYRSALFKIYDNASIRYPLAPCPVIHAYLTDILIGGRTQSVKIP